MKKITITISEQFYAVSRDVFSSYSFSEICRRALALQLSLPLDVNTIIVEDTMKLRNHRKCSINITEKMFRELKLRFPFFSFSKICRQAVYLLLRQNNIKILR